MKRLLMALALTAALGGALSPHAQAATVREQNVGLWNHVCRIEQINTDETITFGSDGTWDEAVCDTIVQTDQANAYDNGYMYYPLDQPRPGVITCSYAFRYGGYWEMLRPPYANSLGAAIITVRDDPWSSAGRQDCSAFAMQLDGWNEAHGFNSIDAPLAPITYCQNCGGGGGGIVGGLNATVPNPPRVKHVAKRPRRICTNCVKH